MSLDTRSVQGSEQLLLAGTMLAFFLIGTLLFHWFIALKRHSRLAFLLLISFLLPCMLHSVPQPPTALILLLVLAALFMDSAQGLTMIMQRRLRMLFSAVCLHRPHRGVRPPHPARTDQRQRPRRARPAAHFPHQSHRADHSASEATMRSTSPRRRTACTSAAAEEECSPPSKIPIISKT